AAVYGCTPASAFACSAGERPSRSTEAHPLTIEQSRRLAPSLQRAGDSFTGISQLIRNYRITRAGGTLMVSTTGRNAWLTYPSMKAGEIPGMFSRRWPGAVLR